MTVAVKMAPQGSLDGAEARRGDGACDATARVALPRRNCAKIRRAAAKRLLDHLLACLPPGSRGTDLLAETTLGKLLQAIESDSDF